MFGSIKNGLSRLSIPIKNGMATARSRVSNLNPPWRFFVAAALLIIVVVVLVWLFDKVLIFLVARSYVDEIAEVLDLNKYLATALAWAAFAAIIVLTRLAFSFSKLRRRAAFAGLIALLIGHSLILWRGTSGEIIDRSGIALKCYVITRDRVLYREHPGIDPTTGRECKPVTPELVEKLRQYEQGNRPNRITSAAPIFFDPGTGRPIIWYYKRDSEIELFDLMGFHPDTGEELMPVSKDIVDLWKKQETRRSAKRIDPDEYPPFDPATGQARIWYHRLEDGEYEFYDHPGYHQQSGEALAPVNRVVLDEWRKWKAQKTEIQQHRQNCSPSPVVSPNPNQFFDAVTGSPRLWYWRGDKGEYEFFQCPGYNPRNGQQLIQFTKDLLPKYLNELKEKQADLRAEQDRQRAEQEQRERKAAQDEADRERREQDEATRRSEAGRRCDELAANPNDSRRVGDGVSYQLLKVQALQASDDCKLAMEQNPAELRFKYQYGRALQVMDRKAALQIQEELASRGYPAAFDNLGWLYYTEMKDPARAVAIFRRGVQLGDSDSMLSLAEMIEQSYVPSANPIQEKIQLYCRAAELGNAAGTRACTEEQEKLEQQRQQNIQQLQQQQMMMQVIQGIVQRVR
jgi:hypothetical protein